MTNLQEAKLAREAEICYATIALVTDYDCWHLEEEPVTVENAALQPTQECRERAEDYRQSVRELASVRTCECGNALKMAILTDLSVVPPATLAALEPIIARYLKDRVRDVHTGCRFCGLRFHRHSVWKCSGNP